MRGLAYDMFDLPRQAEDARRMDRMRNIYHRGQDLAWDGRNVLSELLAKHGGAHVEPQKRPALSAIFSSLLWGELAAWRISAQLADRIEPLEAKMAATSQAHDEARHFYVLYDYLLAATGQVPGRPNWAAEALLETVLETDDLACKLLGMQLQVETVALTIFQHVRERNLCPVLTELLPYFEKDEARHVGLGLQYLPVLVRQMGPLDRARFSAFALKISALLVAGNQLQEGHLRALGMDPRTLMILGKSKQLLVFEQLWETDPNGRNKAGELASLVIEAVAAGMWPNADPKAGPPTPLERARAFGRALRGGGIETVTTTLEPQV